jgi:RecA/RadA recombinase
MKHKTTAKELEKTAKQIQDGDSPFCDPVQKRVFLSTGNTLLNLLLSNKVNGGLLAGRYYLYVGDSSSGKTFASLTLFAEAAHNPAFKDHRFIFDDVERGNMFDIDRFFGPKLRERIEAPEYIDGMPVYSSTIESFYFHVDDAINADKPFIYVLDSAAALTSMEEQETFEKHKKAYTAGKEVSGSYFMGKAKANSQFLRRLPSALAKTNSILVVIDQTRDDLRWGARGKTHSGGYALDFYAAATLWATKKEKITAVVHGNKRVIGQILEVGVRKNRITGQEGKSCISFYPTYGFDDISACVDFLVEEGYWKKVGLKINAPEFEVNTNQEKLVKLIEAGNREPELMKLVGSVWKEIRQAMQTERKMRYGDETQ